MDLDFTEEQNLYRATTRAICDRTYGLSIVREMENDLQGYPVDFWASLVESGITGIVIPDIYSGMGLNALDAVVVFEELGRTLADSPFLESSIFAAKLIELIGTESQRADWLPLIASGDVVFSVCHFEESGHYDSIYIDTVINEQLVRGVKQLVPFAGAATHFLVLTKDELTGEIIIAIVDADSKGVDFVSQDSIGAKIRYQVSFDHVRVVDTLSQQGETWSLWTRAMSFSLIALSAQSVGSSEAMLHLTAEYSKVREQFGKPIGQFQSLSHYMAELAVAVEGSRTLTYQAAWAHDSGCVWQLLAAQAKLQSSDTFRQVAVIGTQIHGGIGFTNEADPQLFYRRAKHSQLEYWDSEYLEARIADLLLGKLPKTESVT